MIDVDNQALIINCIHEDLQSDQEMLSACLRVLDYLKSQNIENLRFISFGAISRAAETETIYEALPIAQYLAGSRLHLLETRYKLVDGEEEVDVDAEFVLQARKDGILYHPDRGEPVSGYEEKLFMYFSLSEAGKSFVEKNS